MRLKKACYEQFEGSVVWEKAGLVESHLKLDNFFQGFSMQNNIMSLDKGIRKELFDLIFHYTVISFLTRRIEKIINPKDSDTMSFFGNQIDMKESAKNSRIDDTSKDDQDDKIDDIFPTPKIKPSLKRMPSEAINRLIPQSNELNGRSKFGNTKRRSIDGNTDQILASKLLRRIKSIEKLNRKKHYLELKHAQKFKHPQVLRRDNFTVEDMRNNNSDYTFIGLLGFRRSKAILAKHRLNIVLKKAAEFRRERLLDKIEYSWNEEQKKRENQDATKKNRKKTKRAKKNKMNHQEVGKMQIVIENKEAETKAISADQFIKGFKLGERISSKMSFSLTKDDCRYLLIAYAYCLHLNLIPEESGN